MIAEAGTGPATQLAIAGCLALPVLGYLAALRRLHARGDRWPIGRTVAGALGIACLGTALLSPLNRLLPVRAESFSAHVSEHLLLAMFAPLALALSAPVTLALRTLPRAMRDPLLALLHSGLVRVLTLGPVVLLLDVGGLYAYYLTPLFAATERHDWLHAVVHAHMVLAGCLFSWYLVGVDPLPRPPSTRGPLVVLLLAAGSHDVLAKVMYAHELPTDADTTAGVRAGAQLLFYGGDLVEVLLAVGVLAQWYARTGRELRRAQRRASAPQTVGGSG